jgi:hypothetical protein
MRRPAIIHEVLQLRLTHSPAFSAIQAYFQGRPTNCEREQAPHRSLGRGVRAFQFFKFYKPPAKNLHKRLGNLPFHAYIHHVLML